MHNAPAKTAKEIRPIGALCRGICKCGYTCTALSERAVVDAMNMHQRLEFDLRTGHARIQD